MPARRQPTPYTVQTYNKAKRLLTQGPDNNGMLARYIQAVENVYPEVVKACPKKPRSRCKSRCERPAT